MPDIGDAKDVVVVEVPVKVGQSVALDDLLVVVESDKASMEIPAPVAGRIASVDVAAGTPVTEGTLLVVVETTEEVPAQAVAAEKTSAAAAMPAAEYARRSRRLRQARPASTPPVQLSMPVRPCAVWRANSALI